MVDDQDDFQNSDASAQVAAKTGQIPLLDDVVFDTDLPFPKPKLETPVRKPIPDENPEPVIEQNVPRPTDLFGGSFETAQTGPHAPAYGAKDLDKLRSDTEQVVDHLVAEYSQEIVSRLKQELTSLLAELGEPETSNSDSNSNPNQSDPNPS